MRYRETREPFRLVLVPPLSPEGRVKNTEQWSEILLALLATKWKTIGTVEAGSLSVQSGHTVMTISQPMEYGTVRYRLFLRDRTSTASFYPEFGLNLTLAELSKHIFT